MEQNSAHKTTLNHFPPPRGYKTVSVKQKEFREGISVEHARSTLPRNPSFQRKRERRSLCPRRGSSDRFLPVGWRGAGGEDHLQHRAVGIGVLAARAAHVRVHGGTPWTGPRGGGDPGEGEGWLTTMPTAVGSGEGASSSHPLPGRPFLASGGDSRNDSKLGSMVSPAVPRERTEHIERAQETRCVCQATHTRNGGPERGPHQRHPPRGYVGG